MGNMRTQSTRCSMMQMPVLRYPVLGSQHPRLGLEVIAAGDAVAWLPCTAWCCCGYHTSTTLWGHLWAAKSNGRDITAGRQGKAVARR